jgi:predicted GIY-YIG superfamily endonuclease
MDPQPATAAAEPAIDTEPVEETINERCWNDYVDPVVTEESKQQEQAMKQYVESALLRHNINLPESIRLSHNIYTRPKPANYVDGMFFVYMITFPSGKCYIGKSNKWPTRLNKHRSAAYRRDSGSVALNHAIRRYGWHNARKELLEYFPTKTAAVKREIELTVLFNALLPGGYNLQVGEGKGKIHNELTKIRMSASKTYQEMQKPKNAAKIYDTFIYQHVTRHAVDGVINKQRQRFSIVNHPLCVLKCFATLDEAREHLAILEQRLADGEEPLTFNTEVQRIVEREPIILPLLRGHIDNIDNMFVVRLPPALGVRPIKA